MNLSTQIAEKAEKAELQAEAMAQRVREERFALGEMERERQKILIDNDDMDDSLREKEINRERFLQRQSSAEVC